MPFQPIAEVFEARRSDLPAVLAIHNHAVSHTTAVYTETLGTLAEREAWFDAKRAAGFPVLVAADAAGEVVGFATFGDFRPWPGYRHTAEHSVYVRHDARGRGVGAALVGALLPRAEALGKHVLVAGIDAENEASVRLHARLGFERVGCFREVGRKFDRWLDLLFMQRILRGPSA